MMVYTKTLKESTKNENKNPRQKQTLLELISEFGKVTGYQINTLKPIVFLYLSTEHMETEIKNRITFTVAQKRRRNT